MQYKNTEKNIVHKYCKILYKSTETNTVGLYEYRKIFSRPYADEKAYADDHALAYIMLLCNLLTAGQVLDCYNYHNSQ